MIHIILVEPVYEGNVGAAARIMNNFGFSSLRIVGTPPSKNDFYLAMHSEQILQQAGIHPTLKDAIADLDRVIAFSRRTGRQKPVDLTPPQMADYCAAIPNLNIGLVFGRETFGLTDEEAKLCPLRCHIPANPAFPSINLAQAVAIAVWELFSQPFSGPAVRKQRAADGIELDKIRHYMLDVMNSAGFFRSHESTNWDSFLAKLLAQLNPSRTMLWRLRQMFNRWHVLVTGTGRGFDKDDKGL
jgi:tRNA/rRNA methyltransferase